MKRTLTVYIADIAENIAQIEKYTSSVDERSFEKDEQLQDAVMRRLEIIGEAVKHIPQSERKKYPAVPWKAVSGMRDVLIHGYFIVNTKQVWNTIIKDLPILKKEIVKMKKEYA